MKCYPSREEFRLRAQGAMVVPVYTEMMADLDTPVSAFMKLRRGKYSYLLESIEGGDRIGRYSFLGRDPSVIIKSKGRESQVIRDGHVETINDIPPMTVLKNELYKHTAAAIEGLPPFIGGAVGYMSYDAVRYFEALPDNNPDDLNMPDLLYILTDTIVIFDNVTHKMTIVYNTRCNPDENLDLVYDRAVGIIAQVKTDLDHPISEEMYSHHNPLLKGEITSSFTQQEYEDTVKKCKQYIIDGDILQCVIAQRMEAPFHGDAFDLYRSLRVINPSPYMFYLQYDDVTLVGSSPEIHARLMGDTVTIRPIAGTRPRGKTPEEDLQMEKELLADEKEKAEHLQLVDLARNDIGRVCEYGTVTVNEYMSIERYSHVMHIVSNAVGRIIKGKDAFDLIAATFPAGTVSGAPKVRAMEIIDELEPTRRGSYAGLVGYFSFNGNFDSCITIRTMLVKNGKVYVQAGAGIVADSVPETEYKETMNKARGLLNAITAKRGGIE